MNQHDISNPLGAANEEGRDSPACIDGSNSDHPTPRSLGLCVTRKDGARHLLGLVEAAARAGVSTEVFLTGEGVHLVRDGRFRRLVAASRVSVCEASYLRAGLDVRDAEGLADRDFTTQWRNAEMVERCDRYLTL